MGEAPVGRVGGEGGGSWGQIQSRDSVYMYEIVKEWKVSGGGKEEKMKERKGGKKRNCEMYI